MWQATPSVFEAKSGLALGARSVGMIQTTRLYVTSRQMWAAVTDRLTTLLFDRPTAPEYQQVGEFVEAHLRFSYLFLWEPGKGRLVPAYRNRGLFYGDEPAAAVERRYLSSYVSTALEYPQHGAKEGSLHEVEFVSPMWRPSASAAPQPTRLAGVLWHRDAESGLGTLQGLQMTVNGRSIDVRAQVLTDLRVGGERVYGFGRIAACQDSAWNFPPELEPGAGQELQLPLDDQAALVLEAHVLYDPTQSVTFEGALEPLVGREWDPHRGAGRRLVPLGVCLAPATAIRLSRQGFLCPRGMRPWQFASSASDA